MWPSKGEMAMTGNIQIAMTVLGGLALFIYGVGLMSEGLTQVAGARMKVVLGYVTKNRVAAIAAGAGITALIQISSATTVMTVGFVNAGLLSLTQANVVVLSFFIPLLARLCTRPDAPVCPEAEGRARRCTA